MKSFYLRLAGGLAFLIQVLFAAPILAEPSYITGTSVNVRTEPNTKAPVVAVVKFMETANILEQGPFVLIDGIGRNLWFKIQTGETTGWIFGSFLTQNYCRSSDGQVLAYAQQYDIDGATSLFRIGFLSKEGRFAQYKIQASSVSFSPSCAYFATDAGSDIIGSIAFYRTYRSDSKPISQTTHDRGSLKWEGNCITFHDIHYVGNGCTLWNEKRFCDGQIKETGKSGRSIFHQETATPDSRCDP